MRERRMSSIRQCMNSTPKFSMRMKMNELNGIPKKREATRRRGSAGLFIRNRGNFPIKISHHVKHLVCYIIHPSYQSLRTDEARRMENEFNVQQSINYSIITTSCRMREERTLLLCFF